ncbi:MULTISPECIES: pepsin-like aspartic protease [Marinomonas]|uniref:A1 family peptidase n=1 Tax=Marinomonas rhodophyticola TaxID=2992803 RepID=A0ABT3KIG7_9GAMM|nr:pepsin-like aspartic protease [Marinomonas sp. KJ51-3]MCW4629867.1 A1 family peptidase [Marinomonas sp. KJ51-3]
MKKSVLVNDNATGLSISLDRGPFQNNGASPWYAYVGVGTSAQALKFSFDTGSNFMWVTSSLCKADTCHHYGDQQFVYQLSSSFSWVDQQTMAVDFGPWGSMAVKTGKDILTLTPDALGQIDSGPISLTSDLYLAQAYQGVQFYELDWDGGIGIPSTTEVSDAPFAAFAYRGIETQQASEPTSFHFFQSLVEQGIVSTECPYVAFLTDMDEGHGQVEFGHLNQDYRYSREYLFLPWDKYSVPYLWTSKITSLALGETQIIAPESTTNPPYFLALDSGSSQFKGDFDVMTRLYNLASHTKDNLIIEIGQTDLGEVGKLVVTSEMYDVLIEAGQQKGKVVTQFQPMEGADYIALVGSVLMDYLYTVYEFNVVEAAGNVSLLPVGMWVFNKSTGPKVITTTQSKPARIFHS